MQNKLSGYGPSLIVLATAMLVLFAGPGAVRKLTYENTEAQIKLASHRLDNNNVLEQINQAYRDIATRVEPSVVHISVRQRIQTRQGERTVISSGSGWIYDEAGHVITNNHVIRDAERIEVQLDSGELRNAILVGFDDTTDIAVLRIPEGRLHPSEIAHPDDVVQQGDIVFAFGSPFDFRFSMSSGVVSGKGRSVGVIRDRNNQRVGYENFIQVDAAINPGNSGGPLTNFRGEVIGMNTAIATGRQQSLEEGQFAGIGLAIPLDMIIPVVDQLIENGFVTKGFLGVNIVDLELDPQRARRLRQQGFLEQGVAITNVIKDGPADRANLKVNDVVVAVNGKPTRSMSQLQSIISTIRPGNVVKIDAWRYDEQQKQGETLAFSVKLDRVDTIMTTGVIPPDHPRDELHQLGIASMQTSTRTIAREFDAQYRPGVMLKALVPNSLLDRQAEPGWTIVGVMDKDIRNVEEFFQVLNEQNLLNGVILNLIDETGQFHKARVEPEQF
ncbi:MAG: trypsin-like peptidase domain-containing protein [Planctomycetota bacterium]|nr:trypsin-like peptidase domain-containing protein [Planctomycetota bacterium]